MVMMSGTALPVGPPWGFVWLLQGGLVQVQRGRGSDPGLSVGAPLWWLLETGVGRIEEAFVRQCKLGLERSAASLQP